MKVKINKKGKKKEYKLISSWTEVTLEKWLKLVSFKTGTNTKEARETIAALSDIPKNVIDQLEIKDVALSMERVSDLQKDEDSSLKRVIEIEGKRYGFHPDLNSITLGEYADIENFIKNDIEKNLPELMAVLYRPIVEETSSGVYTIEAYDGDITIRTEKMKKMAIEQVQSALVFFYHFAQVLLMILQSFLIRKQMEMTKQ